MFLFVCSWQREADCTGTLQAKYVVLHSGSR